VLDDSYEHHVTGPPLAQDPIEADRIVLIVDVWHKALSKKEHKKEATDRLGEAGY